MVVKIETGEVNFILALHISFFSIFQKNVNVCNDKEMAQSERTPPPKTEVGKTKLTIKYLY